MMRTLLKKTNKKTVYTITVLIWLSVTLVGSYAVWLTSNRLHSLTVQASITDYIAQGISDVEAYASDMADELEEQATLQQKISRLVDLEGVTFACILDNNNSPIAYKKDTTFSSNRLDTPKPVGKIGIIENEKTGKKIITTFYSDIMRYGKKAGTLHLSVTPDIMEKPIERYTIQLIVAVWSAICILSLATMLFMLKTLAGNDRTSIPDSILIKNGAPGDSFERNIENKAFIFLKFMVLEASLKHMYRWQEAVPRITPMQSESEHAGNAQRIGSYELQQVINHGNLFDLYLATTSLQNADSKQYIVKKLRKELAPIKDLVEAFNKGAELSVLLNHPNIVNTIEYRKKHQALISEHVRGNNLDQVLTKNKNGLPVNHALHILLKVCQALSHAYNYNRTYAGEPLKLIHGNLIPNNILISLAGEVKLTDFGVSKLIYDVACVENSLALGTSSYSSLEAAINQAIQRIESEGGTVSGSSATINKRLHEDNLNTIYTLGIHFWEMLTGRKLSQKEININEQDERFDALKSYSSETPEGVIRIVNKCLDKDKNRRYQSMKEIVRDLAQLRPDHIVNYDMSNYLYLAPEQIRGTQPDHLSDIYLTGVLMYEMLTGIKIYRLRDSIHLFTSFTDRINRSFYLKEGVNNEVEPLSILVPDISEQLNDVVMKCLEVKRKDRFNNIDEVLDALNTLIANGKGSPSNTAQLADYLEQLFRNT